MKNAFRIFQFTEREDDAGEKYADLNPCDNDKLNGEFVNEIEAIHALRDTGAKGDFVILNVKTF